MNSFIVRPFLPSPHPDYDLVLCTSGAEQRCTHWHKTLKPISKCSVVWVYSRDIGPRANANQAYFAKHGFRSIKQGTLTAKEGVRGFLENLGENTVSRVAVDISSMTRELMATLVHELSTSKSIGSLQVDFVYSRAKFSRPSKDSGLAHRPVPVIPEFAGLWNDPENPLLLIMGVGYEPYLATSFCEFLDPSSVVAFIPDGHEESYVKEIAKQNTELFEHLRTRKELLIKYDVGNPFALFTKVESAVFGRIGKERINIAPYGLKTFALCSFLVAVQYSPQVMIWHLNSNRPSTSVPNRIASGEINGLTVEFKGANKTA